MFKVRGESHELQNRKAIEKIMKPKADFSRSIKLIKLYPDVATDKEKARIIGVTNARVGGSYSTDADRVARECCAQLLKFNLDETSEFPERRKLLKKQITVLCRLVQYRSIPANKIKVAV